MKGGHRRRRVLAALIAVASVPWAAPGMGAEPADAGRVVTTRGVLPPAVRVEHADIVARDALAPQLPEAAPEAGPTPAETGAPGGHAAQSEPPPGPPPGAFGPSPPASPSFLALDDNNTRIPPDTHGAVGPSHVMTTLNSQVRIQDKAGAIISTVTLNSFWASLGPFSTTVGTFDPRVFYDELGGRWIVVSTADPRVASSSLLLAVSATSSPTGSWFMWKQDADTANAVWADYPTLGFNKNWIVVSLNMFDVDPPPNPFIRAEVHAFNKATSYAGGAPTSTKFTLTSLGGTQVPAVTHDSALDTLYLLQNWNGNPGDGTGLLRLYTITGPVASPALTNGPFVSVSSPWADGPPGGADFAPQLGTSSKIQANDSRMHSVVYRNGSLWGVHTVFLPASAPTRSSVQWWNVSTSGGILQRARIDDTPGAAFYTFPSLDVNKNNDVLIGYSRMSATTYASAHYSLRRGIDAPNTLRDDALLKAGEAPYYKIFSGSDNRWGDYSQTAVDPANDLDMWTIQEYARPAAAAPCSPNCGRWGTWWGMLAGPGIKLTETGGSTTVAEAGPVTDTYEVSPNTAPASSVTVSLAAAGGQVTLSPSSLTFTTTAPQTVTVTPVPDSIDEGTVYTDTITHTATSSDPDYSGKTASLTVSITDDDTAGFAVVNPGGMATAEAGATSDTYTIALTSQPTSSVSVSPSAAPGGQVSLSAPSLTFTAANWSAPQPVTVTAIDDAVDEAATHFATISHAVTSADPFYGPLTIPPVAVSIADNDTAGVTFTQTGGSTAVAEAGGSDTYTIVLNSQPTASVTISQATPGGQVSASPGSLTFTAASWNVAQTVTVTAVNDAIDEPDTHSGTITHSATSGDPLYNTSLPTITVSVADNDTAGVRVTQTGGSTAVTEGGPSDTYTIVLDSQPTASVTVTPAAPAGRMTVSPASVTFSAAGWNLPQTITVTAINDSVDQAPAVTQTITHSSGSADPLYNAIPVASVTVTITDNDPLARVTESSGSTDVDESGGTDSYTVVLDGAPASPLTVTISTDAEVTPSPSSLTFTPSNFSTPQTVTVAAVDDDIDDPSPHAGVITHTASASDVVIRQVTASITDNDPVRAGSATLANPAGATLGLTEAAAFRVQCPNPFGPPPSTAQGLDGYVINMGLPDPLGTLTPTGPNASQANFDVYFYRSDCTRIATNDFAQAGPGAPETGIIPSTARWAVVNYVGGSLNGTFAFRY